MSDDMTIDWSYSNARLYESCPRSLFYHYWQQINRNTDSEAADERVLRGQLGAGVVIGNAIHTALGEHIGRWSRGKQTGIKIIRQVARNYIHNVIDANPTLGTDVDPESLIHTTDTHIGRFFQIIWPQIRGHRYILHEETHSFKIGSTKVWVRPDLCTRDSGKFVITDWKSRQPALFEDPSLQLRVYALWAYQEFEPDIDRISTQLVFTSDGRIDHQSVDEVDLTQLEDQIAADVLKWGNPNDRANFSTDESFEKCSNCPYLFSCETGQTKIKNNQ
jgi:hypothetical protein